MHNRLVINKRPTQNKLSLASNGIFFASFTSGFLNYQEMAHVAATSKYFNLTLNSQYFFWHLKDKTLMQQLVKLTNIQNELINIFDRNLTSLVAKAYKKYVANRSIKNKFRFLWILFLEMLARKNREESKLFAGLTLLVSPMLPIALVVFATDSELMAVLAGCAGSLIVIPALASLVPYLALEQNDEYYLSLITFRNNFHKLEKLLTERNNCKLFISQKGYKAVNNLRIIRLLQTEYVNDHFKKDNTASLSCQGNLDFIIDINDEDTRFVNDSDKAKVEVKKNNNICSFSFFKQKIVGSFIACSRNKKLSYKKMN